MTNEKEIQVVYKSVAELTPYINNPRNNAEAVKYVAESIKQFGFKSPIIIDSDGVIVCGHTRLLAAKKLKMKRVPCVVADDLTEEQIKAYRLADNKVAEKAEWDFDLLDLEIQGLPDFDFEALGFEFDFEEEEEPEPKEKKNERLRTDEAYNLPHVDISRCEGFYEMPILFAEEHIPSSLIGFNYALTSKNKETGIHFYIDDYQMERCWANPKKYIEILKDFECCFTPDYSLYLDMPKSMMIWNTFRGRLIGQLMQDAGITVIPTVSWADEDSFNFCFDGLPTNSVLSVSTVGVRKNQKATELWKKGVAELITRKKPKCLLVYGDPIPFDFGNVEVKYYKNSVTERMRDSRNDKRPKTRME